MAEGVTLSHGYQIDEENEVEQLLSTVDDTIFTMEDNWNYVIIECNNLVSKWDQLSTYLGLSAEVIERIRNCGHNKAMFNCMSEALKEWIKQNYKTEIYGKPSWRTLLKAVAMLDMLLCKKLAAKHKSQSETQRKSSSATSNVRFSSESNFYRPEREASATLWDEKQAVQFLQRHEDEPQVMYLPRHQANTLSTKRKDVPAYKGNRREVSLKLTAKPVDRSIKELRSVTDRHHSMSPYHCLQPVTLTAAAVDDHIISDTDIDSLQPLGTREEQYSEFAQERQEAEPRQGRSNLRIKRLPSHCQDKSTVSFKINIVGDIDVGKSTMLNRILIPEFKFGDTTTTVQYGTRGVCVYQYSDETVKLEIMDMPGDENHFSAINNSEFMNVHGTILMFDIAEKQTLLNILSDETSKRRNGKCWIKEVDYRARDDKVPVKIIVGGKIDLKERKVSYEEAERYANGYNLPYMEVSSKENLGIEEVLPCMVRMLMERHRGSTSYGTCRLNHEASTIHLLNRNGFFHDQSNGGDCCDCCDCCDGGDFCDCCDCCLIL